jgi:hyperosmotically inducible protein
MKKSNLKSMVPLAISSFFLITALPAVIQAEDASSSSTIKPDNTAINVRDRNANAVTADQAQQDKSDVVLMQKIRKAVVQDKSLSINAHNVKIIAKNGQVILKGPVNSGDESDRIMSKATRIAGADHVRNELSIQN